MAPASASMAVVLPEPLGPMIATSSPSRTEKSTPRNITVFSSDTCTPSRQATTLPGVTGVCASFCCRRLQRSSHLPPALKKSRGATSAASCLCSSTSTRPMCASNSRQNGSATNRPHSVFERSRRSASKNAARPSGSSSCIGESSKKVCAPHTSAPASTSLTCCPPDSFVVSRSHR